MLHLENGMNCPEFDLMDECLPGLFKGLTNLKHLDLVNVLGFEPALLAHLTSLTSFKLQREEVSDEFWLEPNAEYWEMALLDVLPQLQQLQELQLFGVLGWPPHQHTHNYAALFAASGLTALNLIHSDLDPYFGQAVFAPGVQLPLLRRLQMGWGYWDSVQQCMDPGWEELPEHDSWPLGPGDIDGLVRCCPNVQQLWLTTVIAPGTPMAALMALTALTELLVGGDVIDDVVAVDVLGRMPWRQGQIGIVFSQTLSLAGWQQMTEMLGVEVRIEECRARNIKQLLVVRREGTAAAAAAAAATAAAAAAVEVL
jgi:hypothetical protein